jgi:hypothetical protein
MRVILFPDAVRPGRGIACAQSYQVAEDLPSDARMTLAKIDLALRTAHVVVPPA